MVQSYTYLHVSHASTSCSYSSSTHPHPCFTFIMHRSLTNTPSIHPYPVLSVIIHHLHSSAFGSPNSPSSSTLPTTQPPMTQRCQHTLHSSSPRSQSISIIHRHPTQPPPSAATHRHPIFILLSPTLIHTHPPVTHRPHTHHPVSPPAGTKPQVVSAALCAHLPPQLPAARPRAPRLPPGQHAATRRGLHPLLQVRNEMLCTPVRGEGGWR